MLEGRIVLVTGAGRGLGRQHCLELARLGAAVVVNDLEEGPAQEVAADIERAGGIATVDTTSVSDFGAVGDLIERIVARHGGLDAVVNNAGIVRDRMLTGMSEAEFDLVVDVHLKGTWSVTHHACRYWRDRAKTGAPVAGRVVNTTSGAGLFGNVGQSNYGPAKAAIASLTLITAMEMERYGVTANAISPLARTRMTDGLPAMAEPVDGWDPYDPANASPVVAYLCSEASGWLSGAVLRINGATVQRLRPWAIDHDATYRGDGCSAVEATALHHGLRVAFGALPSGIPAGAGR